MWDVLIFLPADDTSCFNWPTWLLQAVMWSTSLWSIFISSFDWSSRDSCISLVSSVSCSATLWIDQPKAEMLAAQLSISHTLLLIFVSMVAMSAGKLPSWSTLLFKAANWSKSPLSILVSSSDWSSLGSFIPFVSSASRASIVSITSVGIACSACILMVRLFKNKATKSPGTETMTIPRTTRTA